MKPSLLLLTVVLVLGFGASQAAAQAPDGKALYEKNCRACHGARGTPPAALAKQQKIPKWDAAFLTVRSDDSLVAVMKHGGKNMKGFAGKLKPDEMTAIA